MSELIQESKYITVQEFMPKWTIAKEEVGDTPLHFPRDSDIEYISSKSCLVGEAHGFSDSYTWIPQMGGCDTCSSFSHTQWGHGATKSAQAGVNGTLRDFYTFKETLYNHFMEAHPEKLLRK